MPDNEAQPETVKHTVSKDVANHQANMSTLVGSLHINEGLSAATTVQQMDSEVSELCE